MQEFEICYGLSELPSNAVVTYRKAAKAVIEKDGKLLLIYTNQGDYKFPVVDIKIVKMLQNVLSGKCWKNRVSGGESRKVVWNRFGAKGLMTLNRVHIFP